MVKVSVIIPIFKTEKFIERCVRSLMEQTLDSIEYIFVNDCTPDKSVEIIERVVEDYPHRKSFIKIISHEKNRGLASTRNTGLRAATGNYIIYCDSDDWIDTNAYELMYLKAIETNADIVVSDYYKDYPNFSQVQKQDYPEDSINCIQEMLRGHLHCATWNKLIKKSIYINNKIIFPDGINMWEDVLTVIPLFYYAKKIVYIPHAFYHYIQYNTNSYTFKLNNSSMNNLVSAINLLSDFFYKTNTNDLFKEAFLYKKLTVKLNLMINSDCNKRKELNKLYPETNHIIWSYKVMSLYWRIALICAKYNCLGIFNIMVLLSKLKP